MDKEFVCNAGDIGDVSLIPGSGRSPGRGNGNPLQYSCLENPMDRGAWQATVHGVTKGWTWLSDWRTARVRKRESKRSHWEFGAIVRSWVIQSKLGVTPWSGRGVTWSDLCLEVSLQLLFWEWIGLLFHRAAPRTNVYEDFMEPLTAKACLTHVCLLLYFCTFQRISFIIFVG